MNSAARVEGNSPTESILLAEYKQVISNLNQNQAKSTIFPSLENTINVMIEWLMEYQDKAVNFESIVLSTIVNPWFRGKFFTLHYPEHNTTA